MGIIAERRAKVKPGEKHERLTVIGLPFAMPRSKSGRTTYVVCECECGSVLAVEVGHLKSGNTKSCGCLNLELSTARLAPRIRHGQYATKLYRCWTAMLTRCRNQKHEKFKCYGGRGITVCPEWHDSQVFIDWAMANGYQVGLTIERVNVHGNYEPGNCTWIPKCDQAKNMQRSLKNRN